MHRLILLFIATFSLNASELAQRIAAQGDVVGEIHITTQIPVNADLTVPENITLKISAGGGFRIATGSTLTINGGLEAGYYRIFSGEGQLAGTPKIPAVLPEWFHDGKYNDEADDWSPAINRALAWAAHGVHKVSLLNRRYNVAKVIRLGGNKPQNFSGVTLEGSVRSGQYEKGTLLLGNTGSGNPVIECSNADSIHLKNLGILRGSRSPSDIGILQARCAGRMWAGDQYHENIYINMGSAVKANNGFGTIGVINIAGEETRYHNLQVWANLPLIISWSGGRETAGGTDVRRFPALRRTNGDYVSDTALEVKSALGLESVAGYSNTVFALTGLNRLVAYDYVSPCVLINMAGMVDLGWTFMQKRNSGEDGAGFKHQNGSHVYALEIWNCFQFNHTGSIEGARGYLLNRRGLYNATAKVTIAGSGEKSLPAILLLDDGSDDKNDFHTNLNDCRFSIFSYDLNRPAVASRNLNGSAETTRFILRNCDIRTNQPYSGGQPNPALAKRTPGTAWYFGDGHIPPGGRDFIAEPNP